MNRLRRWSALLSILPATLLLAVVRGQDSPAGEKKTDEKPAEKWLLDRSLAVTPRAAPVPALKYRLYPSVMERKEGNAVPMYLRFAHERIDVRKKQLREEPEKWNKLPLEKLPLAEVKKFLDSYKYNFRQLELGARRKTADWNYSLDAGDPISILLPDAQEMRTQARLLVLKARLEIVEGRYADAIRTLETGFSFSQQVSQGPFLISALVGIACVTQFADCLLELIERPDAPNVYWALTVLPRPFIDLRRANELEQQMLEMQVPDMADLHRSRSAEEWDAALKRVRQEISRVARMEHGHEPKTGNAVTDPAGKSPDLPVARKYLAEVVGMPAAKIETMPAAEVLLLYLSNYYHEIRDEVFKASYLPYAQASPLLVAAEKRLKSVADTEAGQVARLFLPAVTKVQLAQVRIERKLAALRVIEALRMHAAAHGGQLPDKLAQVTIVPVPNDPGTGRPFEYQRDGRTATLTSRIAGEPLDKTGLRYRVTVRK
ncbi:MAG TPA: hypothetical protein VN688_17195 [Gemmataceae bacterium]|nr:hypothetical protein [Gemmataceae bacterium]